MNILRTYVKLIFHLPMYRLPLIIAVSLLISTTYYVFGGYSTIGIIKNFLYTFLLWQGNYAFSCVCSPFEQDYTKPRLGIYITFAAVFSLLSVFIINLLVWEYNEKLITYLGEFLTAFGVTMFISLIYFSASYFRLFKESVMEKEALKRAQIENEVKVLNSQINPHFLFNSLNTLMSIIPDNSDLALKFTRKFADVYRYVLQSRHKELISLAEEIKFVNNYIFLMKIRHEDDLHFEISPAIWQTTAMVPPLVVQMLCENAVKHNTISQSHRLHLKIYREGDNICVWNNRNPRLQAENGTGTGLENIRKRYEYLAGQTIVVADNPESFAVKIPLLNVKSYEVSNR